MSGQILEEVSQRLESLNTGEVLVDLDIAVGRITVRKNGYVAHVKSLGHAAVVNRLKEVDDTFASVGVPSLTYHSSTGVLRDIGAFLLVPELES